MIAELLFASCLFADDAVDFSFAMGKATNYELNLTHQESTLGHPIMNLAANFTLSYEENGHDLDAVFTDSIWKFEFQGTKADPRIEKAAVRVRVGATGIPLETSVFGPVGANALKLMYVPNSKLRPSETAKFATKIKMDGGYEQRWEGTCVFVGPETSRGTAACKLAIEVTCSTQGSPMQIRWTEIFDPVARVIVSGVGTGEGNGEKMDFAYKQK